MEADRGCALGALLAASINDNFDKVFSLGAFKRPIIWGRYNLA